ncbi:MAG: T9SS type A sorting domain-containing protein, partial [Bacteroidota bacterium]
QGTPCLMRAVHQQADESSLLVFDSVYVVNQNPDAPSNFGEFSIYADSTVTAGLRVRGGVSLSSLDLGQNFNTDSLTYRQRLNYIRGILTYNFGNWKLQPRNRNDVYGFGTSTGTSIRPVPAIASTRLRIFPNPGTDMVRLALDLEGDATVRLRVMDAQGRLHHQDQWDLQAGNAYGDLETAGWPQGIYLVEVLHQGGFGLERLLIRRP